MKSNFLGLFKRIVGVAVALGLVLSLLITPFGNSVEARRSSMSGDYEKDTVEVIHNLQETIALPQDADEHAKAESDAIELITDYISLYRNRQKVNSLNSFTTMQTALNSLAGHYKNYANRPVPDALKDRLEKELAKAEKSVARGT